MNIRCVNSTDKTNFKAGFLWSTSVPQKYTSKLTDAADGFVKNTLKSDYCIFIDKMSGAGDINSVFLGQARRGPEYDDLADCTLDLVSKSDFPPVNVNSKDFLTQIVDRFNGMLTGTKALDRDPEYLSTLAHSN